MIGNNKTQASDIKIRTYYYFNNIVNINGFSSKNINIDKKHLRIFLFTKLNTKHQVVQNLCILTSIK